MDMIMTMLLAIPMTVQADPAVLDSITGIAFHIGVVSLQLRRVW
jgi:hypothetical protein